VDTRKKQSIGCSSIIRLKACVLQCLGDVHKKRPHKIAKKLAPSPLVRADNSINFEKSEVLCTKEYGCPHRTALSKKCLHCITSRWLRKSFMDSPLTEYKNSFMQLLGKEVRVQPSSAELTEFSWTKRVQLN